MGEKFDICCMTAIKEAIQRREVVDELAALSSAMIPFPIWLTRVQRDGVTGGAWAGEPITASLNEVVCLYPRERSSAGGAWLIEVIGDKEVWTLSLPIETVRSHPMETMDTLWRIGGAYSPCVAGAEYSMAAVCRAQRDVLA